MKDSFTNKKILSFILFFFACLFVINSVEAADLEPVFNASTITKCDLTKGNNNNQNLKPYLSGLYVTDQYAFFTSIEGSSYYVSYLGLQGCNIIQANGNATSGKGSDIAFYSNKYYVVSGTSAQYRPFSLNNKGQISLGTAANANMIYTGLAYDTDNKRFIGYRNDVLYSASALANAPTQIGTTYNSDNSNKSLDSRAIDYYKGNIYVAKVEKSSETSYILVYNATNGNYKYTIKIAAKSGLTLHGLSIHGGEMYLGYTNASNRIVLAKVSGLDNYEKDWGGKVAKVELSHQKIVVVQNNPFDYTNLTAEITYRNGAVESVPLNASNTSITGFDSSKVGIQYVTLSYNGYSWKFDVEVVSISSPVNSISLNKKEVSIGIGGESKITVIFNPKDATNQGVTWSSANPAIATVDERGVVRGVATGETTVTATSVDGNKKASATVKVLKEISSKELYVTDSIVISKYGEFDYSNLFIKTVYTDGEEDLTQLNEENCEIEGFDNKTVGVQNIIVIYEENRYDLEITISELETKPDEPKKKTEPQVKKIEPTETHIEASRTKDNRVIILFIILSSIILVVIAAVLIAMGMKFKSRPPMQ